VADHGPLTSLHETNLRLLPQLLATQRRVLQAQAERAQPTPPARAEPIAGLPKPR